MKNARDYKIVLTTVDSEKEARRLANGAVRNRKAACVNLIPMVQSTYWWKKKVTSSKEFLLLLKTKRSQVPALCRWIRKNHSYDLPELLVLSIEQGESSYLSWISDSLKRT